MPPPTSRYVVSKFCETFEPLAEASPEPALNPLRVTAFSTTQDSQSKPTEPSKSNRPSFPLRVHESWYNSQKTKRRSNDDAYERRRQFAKQRAVTYREAKAARRTREKERQKLHLFGILWGYDPSAGLVSNVINVEDDFVGCYMFPGPSCNIQDYGSEEIDLMGRRTGRLWHQGSKWGIEYGGPGQKPDFEASRGRQGRLPVTSS